MKAALHYWRAHRRFTLILPTYTPGMDRLRATVLRQTDCPGAHAFADFLELRSRREVPK